MKEFSAYLFVHFIGAKSGPDSEQIYFSVSRDGTDWRTLNGGAPVLVSDLGEKGARDPHIIRSPEGNRYFITATDLSIYSRRASKDCWKDCQENGSRSIVIWESDNLADWSAPRLVQVAADNAGCAWAPESVYDREKNSYMVFWASKTSDDGYRVQRIYRSFTKDFITFTSPELYIDGGNISNIDTTFLEYNGVYYRFTKNETRSSIIMERSESLDGPFTEVRGYMLNGEPGNTVTGYEGPTAYKLNDGNKWCLLLDYFSMHQGYKPFVTDDIAGGVFKCAADFKFDDIYRHGTALPITADEYETLMRKYAPVNE